MRVTTATAAVTLVLLLVAVPRVEAQPSLDAARQLYASAEYESALTMLDGLRMSASSSDDRRSIEMYRVLCLVATSRASEAEGAIAAFVSQYPLYRPADDLPPRIRNTFNAARKRILPAAIQAAYQEAKAAFDIKDYATAERGFAQVLEVLNDPDASVQAAQPPLKDLGMLATGFRELSAKAKVPVEQVAAAPPKAPAIQELPRAMPRPAARIYSADDPNVVPPIAITQSIPSFPGAIRTPHSGVLEVLIDDAGNVETASMLAPISPQFDKVALNAAKTWQYRPARLDGVPVKFLKRIQLNIVPAGSND